MRYTLVSFFSAFLMLSVWVSIPAVAGENKTTCAWDKAVYAPHAQYDEREKKYDFRLKIEREKNENIYPGATLLYFVTEIRDRDKKKLSSVLRLPWACTANGYGTCSASIPVPHPVRIDVMALNTDFSRAKINDDNAPAVLLFPNAESKIHYAYSQKDDGNWYTAVDQNDYFPHSFPEIWMLQNCESKPVQK